MRWDIGSKGKDMGSQANLTTDANATAAPASQIIQALRVALALSAFLAFETALLGKEECVCGVTRLRVKEKSK